MKKIILSTMIASVLIAMNLHSMGEPERQMLLKRFKPQLQNIGINFDKIKNKAAKLKLTLRGLDNAQTVNTITLYEGLNRGIEKLEQTIKWAEGQQRTWGWVLLPKLKSQLKNNIQNAKDLQPELKRASDQLLLKYPQLKTLKLQREEQ